ncbi:MAG: glycosyltransferase [Thermodesulfobacteriota bacterium]
MDILEFAFWFSTLIMIYAYFGYPFVLVLLGKVLGRQGGESPIISEPKVSVILVVQNEQGRLPGRLRNLLRSDYPREKLEILVVSDGSDDETNRILLDIARDHKGDPKIVPILYPEKRGKSIVIPEVVSAALGEIFVFADARQDFCSNSIRHLVSHFGDPSVGAVTGQLILSKGGEDGAVGENLVKYWEYEKWVRSLESGIRTVSCVTGAIYAVRKDLFPPLPPQLLAEDLYVTLAILSRGHDVLYDPEAVAYDQVQSEERELSRKRRTLCGNYQILSMLLENNVVLKQKPLFVLLSHKGIRLVIPFILVAIIILNGFLAVLSGLAIYKITFIIQIMFYGMGVFHYIFKFRGIALSRMAFAYMQFNLSAIFAYIKFRKSDYTW